MADRSEMCPDASFPFLRFTATVSSVVLTLKVESNVRSSSPSSPGQMRKADRFALFWWAGILSIAKLLGNSRCR